MRIPYLIALSLAAGWVAAVRAAGAGPAPTPAKPLRTQAAKAAPAPRPAAPKPASDAAPEVTSDAADFFEAEVRPVLAAQCAACHGPRVQQSGLRLDSREAILKGAAGKGPAVVPGDPDKSPLIRAVRYDHTVKMPPQGKLPQRAIDALTEWVRRGAPWPASPTPGAGSQPDPSVHWAFRPVRKPAAPSVKNPGWVRTPIDAFILARLEEKGLKPSPAADRRTLIRRAYLGLTGLPPTAEEVAAFLADRSPDAFDKVVDRLLASPRYGERWGRYWLDVARYADTKGYVFEEERRFPYSYTYRDWVIDALNRDLPYDQFLLQQIAADQLPLEGDRRPLAALGFLTLGRRFLNNRHDIIDDRIDVVFRGTQALTVSCARCHDHKYDPIPTEDYYSLYGVFASSEEPRELPLLAEPERTQAYLEFEKQLAAVEEETRRFLEAKHRDVLALAKGKIAESLLAAREVGLPDADLGAIAQRYELPRRLVRRWKDFLDGTRQGFHPVFGAWHGFAALPEEGFAEKAAELARSYAVRSPSDEPLNPEVAKLFEGPPPTSLKEAAERYARLLSAPPVGDPQLLHALDSIGGPLQIPLDQVEGLLTGEDQAKLRRLRSRAEELRTTSPAAPPRAMVLQDLPEPVTPRVLLRGDPNRPGDEVPRRFLAVLSGPERRPFRRGSGRLEMAQAIASKRNPLTARVMVNRVWLHHFGKPLVGTPSDFGLRSEPPTHPELLDYLAWRFMEEGWSLKKLHRLILLSSVYQQGSGGNPRARAVDPENRLLWRMNRRRLDLEALRDSLLFVSGRLDETRGGPSVEITGPSPAPRRTVYGFIERQNLPGLFRTFDFASPDSTSPQRHETTVPQQALFLMNSPFVMDLAGHLAESPEVASRSSAADRIQALYRRVFGRFADPWELQQGLRFLSPPEEKGGSPDSGADASAWAAYAQALLLSNEFAFVD